MSEPKWSELAVWWVSDAEADWLMQRQPERHFGWTGLFQHYFAGYIADELCDRNGRAGRGRLWVGKHPEVARLPGLPVAFDCDDKAGIVIERCDIGEIPLWLGVVTDCYGNVLTHFSQWQPDGRFKKGEPNPNYESARSTHE